MAVCALALPLSVLAFLNHNTIAFGVSAGPMPAGTKRPEAVREALARAAQEHLDAPFTLRVNDKELTSTPRALGVTIDTKRTLADAYAVGRTGNPLLRISEQVRAALFGIRVPLAVTIADNAFAAFFTAQLEQDEQPAREAQLAYNERTGLFETAPEQEGSVIDRSALRYELLHNAASLKSNAVAAAHIRDIPFLRKEMVEPLEEEANRIIAAAPFTLTWAPPDELNSTSRTPQAGTYRITKTQLKDLLGARRAGDHAVLDVKESELSAFLVQLAPTLNRKPQNAVLTVEDGKVTEFAISQSGVSLNIDESMQPVRDGILAGRKTIQLAVSLSLPEVRTETIENLGLVSLIGTGESNFAGSSAARAFNVKLGAQKLNGWLIKPGEEFSFVNAIGEIDSKEGWQAGLVIKGGVTVPEYGGGVCQVSTTMFRAAVFAGLPITERFPHSLPVVYYNPQGFDATVYGPHPDFRFVNDTPSNILVQTKVEGTKLTFEFYGTPDGREVKVDGPHEYDKKPDGSLKAVLTREVFRDGTLAKKDTFRSVYRSPKQEAQQRNPLE